jgi:hypothetical protein
MKAAIGVEILKISQGNSNNNMVLSSHSNHDVTATLGYRIRHSYIYIVA